MASKLYQISDDTPIAMLTVGQLRNVINASLEEKIPKSPEPPNNAEKRYVHGVSGIKSLFNCSYPTAHKLKETIIKDAVHQQGRVIIVDADLAMKLFRDHQQVKSVRDLEYQHKRK